MNKKSLFTSAIALTLAAGCLTALPRAMPAVAAEQPAAATATKSEAAEQQEFVKVSENGFTALRDMEQARLAIFRGEPDAAKTLLDQAKVALAAASDEASELQKANTARMEGKSGAANKTAAGTDTASATAASTLIPVDARTMIADDFVLTPEKRAHIDKANQHLHKGKSREAIEELRQGDIHVSLVKVLLPVETTQKNLDTALKLMGEQKYYEANLALKSVDDGLVVESERFVELPKPAAAAAHQTN